MFSQADKLLAAVHENTRETGALVVHRSIDAQF